MSEAIKYEPETSTAVERARQFSVDAKALVIRTPEQYVSSADDLKRVKALARDLDTKRKTMTAPLDESKKSIMDFFRAPLAFLEEAETAIKNRMKDYNAEQARLAKVEQDLLDAIAAKEREKLATERAAIERKEREKVEALQRERDEAIAAGNARKAAQIERKVEKVEEQAAEKTDAIAIRESMVSAPTVVREIPKVAGISKRVYWKFRVVDPALVPREWLVVDEARLQTVVNALHADVRIPGIEVYSEEGIAAGRT